MKGKNIMNIEAKLTRILMKYKSFFLLSIFLFGVGLICHGYMLFNKLPNFDEVGSVNGFLGIATLTEDGRFPLWAFLTALFLPR